MTDLEQQRLIVLLTQPRESLNVEYKSWLDLSSNHGKATLAKAAISLANHGGGTIVIGMKENESDKATPVSKPKPSNITRYDAVIVNAAINRFADPKLACEVQFAIHPDTDEEHAFVVIPGNVSVPVMSTRDSGDDIKQQTCYMRKPGPKSEPPYTSEEWRTMLDRCVWASRGKILESIRAIVLGSAQPITLDPSDSELLADFRRKSHQRWLELTNSLSKDSSARFPHGYFEIAFLLSDIEPLASLTKLREILRDGPAQTSGWPPFITLSRAPFRSRVVDDAIENWLGDPQGEKVFNDAYSLPFWRAHPSGCFYQIEGYMENIRLRDDAPGTNHYPEFAIARLAHFLWFAQNLAVHLDDDTDVIVACKFTGLENRKLSGTPQRPIFEHHLCHDPEFHFQIKLSQAQISGNLVEVISEQLRPLYERFDFYELKQSFVSDILDM